MVRDLLREGKNMKLRIYTLVALFFLLPFCSFFIKQALADDKTAKKEVVAKIAAIVTLLRDGYAREYKEARGIHFFHTPTSSSIAVAIFTIEGFESGNNHTQFMAVFATLGKKLKNAPPRPLSLLDVAAIGGKGWRGVDTKNVGIAGQGGDIAITLNTQEYRRGDPMCCPSKKSKTVYVIRPQVRGRLKEVKK
jgi:hypothetical protein